MKKETNLGKKADHAYNLSRVFGFLKLLFIAGFVISVLFLISWLNSQNFTNFTKFMYVGIACGVLTMISTLAESHFTYQFLEHTEQDLSEINQTLDEILDEIQLRFEGK